MEYTRPSIIIIIIIIGQKIFESKFAKKKLVSKKENVFSPPWQSGNWDGKLN